jgi:hypothetical protein
MLDSFLLTVFIYILPLVIILFFWTRVLYSYGLLYRRKKNDNYSILPGESTDYLYKGESLKIFASPFTMLSMIFERHRDENLNNAAKKFGL